MVCVVLFLSSSCFLPPSPCTDAVVVSTTLLIISGVRARCSHGLDPNRNSSPNLEALTLTLAFLS